MRFSIWEIFVRPIFWLAVNFHFWRVYGGTGRSNDKRWEQAICSVNQLVKLCKFLCYREAELFDIAVKEYSTEMKLGEIQSNVLFELQNSMEIINEEFKDYFLGLSPYIIPVRIYTQQTSSYSSGMHIMSSDIDFTIYVPDLPKQQIYEKVCETIRKHGFAFKSYGSPDDPNLTYAIHNKFVDGVEIEVKVRNYYGSAHICKLHGYLNNKYDPQNLQKPYLRYMKHILSHTSVYYKIKHLIYENALAEFYVKRRESDDELNRKIMTLGGCILNNSNRETRLFGHNFVKK